MMDGDGGQLRRMARVLWILWSAFLGASVLYLLVGFLIARQRSPEAVAAVRPEMIRPMLYAIAGGLAVATFVVRGRLMNRTYRDPDAAIIGTQAAYVAGWAMSETIAIIGLVLVILGGSLSDAVPPVALAFIAILFQRPSEEALRDRLARGA